MENICSYCQEIDSENWFSIYVSDYPETTVGVFCSKTCATYYKEELEIVAS